MKSEQKSFVIDGPEGDLEGVVHEVAGHRHGAVGMVMCHPHPLHGGAMGNKVVTTVAKACTQMGIPCARFNFRGVGASGGAYAQGVGEQEDLKAVVAWFKDQYAIQALWLGGFSFGSYVAASVADVCGATVCLSVAPPVHHFDFSGIHRGGFRWVVIQGGADEVVDAKDVYAWYEGVVEPCSLVKMPGVGHFFHGQLLTLGEILVRELSEGLIKP
jgi:uncharacterized protein